MFNSRQYTLQIYWLSLINFLKKSSNLTASIANLRIPSANFSVAIGSSFKSHRNCCSSRDTFWSSSSCAINKLNK